eukprot:3800682-Pyramimonas_sp.AAC.4
MLTNCCCYGIVRPKSGFLGVHTTLFSVTSASSVAKGLCNHPLTPTACRKGPEGYIGPPLRC